MICQFYRWLDDGAGLAERATFTRTVRPRWAAIRQAVRHAAMEANERAPDTASYEAGGGPEAGDYAAASGRRYVRLLTIGGVWEWCE